MASCPYGIAFKYDGKITPLWCGKWSCERCRVTNSKLWAWRANLQLEESRKEAYFWSFTLRPNIKTPYQGFRALPKLWDSLRKIMQRKTGKWTYLAFVECHPKRSKIPHFHVISLTECPTLGTHIKDPIKDLAWLAGFGYQAKDEPIVSGRAGAYVAKYASKHDPAMPRNFRRCRCSRDWAKLPEVELMPYLVKSRNETLSEFIMRVHRETFVSPDMLYERWIDGCDEYRLETRG